MAIGSSIFISYSHKSQAAKMFINYFKSQIKLYNEQRGFGELEYRVWTDQDLIGGVDWAKKIDEAIDDAFVILVAITPDSLKSHYVTYEWSYAMGKNKYIIPIILEKIDDKLMHKKLKDIQYEDLSEVTDYETPIQKLIGNLKAFYSVQIDIHEHAKDIAQRILNYLELARRQRLSGNYLSAMNVLSRLEKIIQEFHDNFDTQADTRTEIDDLEDDIYYEIGYINYLLGEQVKAKVYYDKALMKNSEHVPSFVGKGVLYQEQADVANVNDDLFAKTEQLQHAEQYFSKALHIQPDAMNHNGESVWASLGGVNKRTQDIGKAIINYQKALDYKKSASTYNNLGLLFFDNGNISEMIANFRLGLFFANAQTQLKPDDGGAHMDKFVAETVLNGSRKSREVANLDSMLEIVIRIMPQVPLKRLHNILEELLELNQKYRQMDANNKDMIDENICKKALNAVAQKLNN